MTRPHPGPETPIPAPANSPQPSVEPLAPSPLVGEGRGGGAEAAPALPNPSPGRTPQTHAAQDRLDRFVARFGEPYRRLAWYAALPLILTPELLGYLRTEFLRGRDGVRWIAEADLVLSDLCRPVGYEQYALDQGLRAHLVAEMRACLGEGPMREAARLLLRYVRRLGPGGAGLSRVELQAEQWSAMAYLEEHRGEVASQLAAALADGLTPAVADAASVGIPAGELARLVRLTDELAPNLAAHPELLDYAALVARLLRSPADLRALAERLAAGESLPVRRVEGVAVPDLRGDAGPVATPEQDDGPEPPSVPTPFRDPFLDGSGDGPEMVWLPGGAFRMGSPPGVGNDDERPAYRVSLSDYGIGKYPITVGEFRRFVAATGYRTEAESGGVDSIRDQVVFKTKNDVNWRKPNLEQYERHPVVCISWNDARAYCDWLSKQTGQQYGLLTEEQWECACRAASDDSWCFGNDESKLGDFAWYAANSHGGTAPVNTKIPNAWGLYHMHGLVWEWCEDLFAAYDSDHQPMPSKFGLRRVTRGGSWGKPADACRSARRNSEWQNHSDSYTGFRLLRTGSIYSYPFALGPRRPELLLEPIPNLRDSLRDGGDGPPMVWLPGGLFAMGEWSSQWAAEKPVHHVRIDAFSIGQFPVTFDEYDRFCEVTGRNTAPDRRRGRGARPVTYVNWDDAQVYCAWLSEQSGATYRLATEAEWEYACRAGSTTPWSFGSEESRLGDYAWYSENAVHNTYPVGEKLPNAWHLHDMHGNILEWCQDWYSGFYYQQRVDGDEHASRGRLANSPTVAEDASGPEHMVDVNPSGPEWGFSRVVRGGCVSSTANGCRSAYREGMQPDSRFDMLGFRLARTGPWLAYPITHGHAQTRPWRDMPPRLSDHERQAGPYYPSELVERVLLPDGAQLVIRPLHPEDANRIQEFVRSLSDRTKYFRYLLAIKEFTPEMLVRLTQLDYDRNFALVATIEKQGLEVLVAKARYQARRFGESCEFAVVVSDAMQRMGIGTRMLRSLMAYARTRGFRIMDGEVLTANRSALTWLHSLEFRIHTDPDDPATKLVTKDL